MLNFGQVSVSLLRKSNLQSSVNLQTIRCSQAWSIGIGPRRKTVAIQEKTKWLGFLVPLGSFVHERDVFFRQKGLKFHPGLNVSTFDDRK